MRSILKEEYGRMFHSKEMKIAVMIGLVFAIAQAVHYQICDIETIYNSESEVPMVCWFSYLGRDIQLFYRSLFYTLFPIITVLPFSVSYFNDKESGYEKHLYMLSSRKSYAVAKYITALTGGGIVVVLPLMLSLFLHAGFVSTAKPDELCLQAAPRIGEMFCNTFYEHPFVYAVLMMVINYLIGCCICGITLCYSLFAKKKYSVYMFGFVVWLMQQFLFAKIDLDTWCYGNIASPISEKIYLLPCFLLIGATLVVTGCVFVTMTSRKDIL